MTAKKDIVLEMLDCVDDEHPNAPDDVAGSILEAKRMHLDLLESLRGCIRENNGIRRQMVKLQGEVHQLRERFAKTEQERHAAMADARTATTMAMHWKLQAKGGDYDATQEPEDAS